jgi:hypothetical protein
MLGVSNSVGSVHPMDSTTEYVINQWCTYGLNSPVEKMG